MNHLFSSFHERKESDFAPTHPIIGIAEPGDRAPHKAFLLLSIIDGNESGWITGPHVELSRNMVDAFLLLECRHGEGPDYHHRSPILSHAKRVFLDAGFISQTKIFSPIRLLLVP